MPTVHFSPNFRRHVACPETVVEGATVSAALAAVFAGNDDLRGYVLDDRGVVRKHVALFVNGEPISDRVALADPVGPADDIWVIQALSGG